MTPPDRRAWFDNYVRTITQRVIRELADLERLADIPRLLSLCAVRTGTELNTVSIASELGVPARTLSAHLAHLPTAFLIRLIPAWSTNLSARVIRRPKLVMTDVGFAAHLQGVTVTGLGRPQTQFGPLLETLVATEVLPPAQLVAQLRDALASPGPQRCRGGPNPRTSGRQNRRHRNQATGTPRAEDLTLDDRLGDRFHFGCLLGTAPEATPFGPKLAALPRNRLWDPFG